MCSISWHWDTDTHSGVPALSLWFNRDERRERVLADPPSIFKEKDITALMPIDPKGGGTWFTANEHGLVATLLNFYDIPPQTRTTYRSRGLLVRELGHCASLQEATDLLQQYCHDTTQPHFPAFSLFLFDIQTGQTHLYRWDEENVSSLKIESHFFSSSSWRSSDVLSYRNTLFQKLVETSSMPNAEFHRHAEKDQQAWSVFMSREKTRTVSIIELITKDDQIKLSYFDRSNHTTHLSEIPLSPNIAK